MQDLWTLKYRAGTLEEMLGNEHAVTTLSELAQSGTLPHLILYGPENSGKTTASLALARQTLWEYLEKQFCILQCFGFF